MRIPESVFRKLARADELHEQLVQETLEHPVEIECPIHLSDDGYTFEVMRPEHLPNFPERWYGILADCLHNIRASFDVLLWTLIQHYCPGHHPALQQLSFPTCNTESDWLKAEKLLHDYLPAAVVQRIKDLQPFAYEPPEEGFLHILAMLDNLDKHRHPLTPAVRMNDWEVDFHRFSIMQGEQEREGGVWYAHAIDTLSVGDPIAGMCLGVRFAPNASVQEDLLAPDSRMELAAELKLPIEKFMDIRDVTQRMLDLAVTRIAYVLGPTGNQID